MGEIDNDDVAVYADYETDPNTGEVFTVTNRVAQPAGVEGAPERVYVSRFHESYTAHNCQFSYERKYADDIEYTRATPVDLDERARRAAEKFDELLRFTSKGYQSLSPDFAKALADIIAAEFKE